MIYGGGPSKTQEKDSTEAGPDDGTVLMMPLANCQRRRDIDGKQDTALGSHDSRSSYFESIAASIVK